MKKIIIIFILTSLMGCVKQLNVQPPTSNMTIITSLKATYLLAQTLTQNTPINVELVVPKNYSMNSHARYFKSHNLKLHDAAIKSSACITIRSVWNHDDLYPFSRRSNVRIVEIDGSSPVDKTQAGVKLVKITGTDIISPYIWRSPANLTKMADFISKDICQLYPDQASNINSNLKLLKKNLFKLRTKYELKFAELEAVEAISLTADFDYLISEFGIDVTEYFLKQEIDWDKKDYDALSKSIINNGTKIVICKRIPQKKLYKTIITSGAKPVVLTTLTIAQGTNLTPKTKLLNLYSLNLDSIYSGLAIVKNKASD
ncbi:metal ABC transporter solute-binding protein, Zn/Mn family [Maridesulfovibrio hydrothermalis]|uniref:Periplasmic solute binding protein n=1 Tax=Maridesulfovibrio hydrothermalis AM13 = DSM 14728 TaxID=1121451 RepID=L0R8H8_9BACT|nr:zinc ABC transporter substrate-binding protein [Maridesulfovibrio hydrothermalis]CCO23068.1 Periplasmic solute binding protein [Maridesulfovibrio hydrothermalis AM13 = DSM 14728]